MKDRPMPVTVVAWILLVFTAFGFLGMCMSLALRDQPVMQQYMQRLPVSFNVMMAVGFGGLGIRLVCALGFFFRWNWARYVYVLWCIVAFAYAYRTSPYPLFTLLSLPLPVAVIVVVFLPASNRWFAGKAVG